MKDFNGPVLFLDRSDINTDEIIPAKYLTELTKEALQPHLLEDLKLPSFLPERDISDKRAIVTRSNFGCGSSREHAPWALEVNGIHTVIGVSFARIFRQNMFNSGMIVVELSPECIEELFSEFAPQSDSLKTLVSTDIDNGNVLFQQKDKNGQSTKERNYSFTLTNFEKELVRYGGWVDYADSHY